MRWRSHHSKRAAWLLWSRDVNVIGVVEMLSDDGDFFVLSPDDYADAEEAGEITAVFHSHPKSLAIASDADRMGCEKSGCVGTSAIQALERGQH